MDANQPEHRLAQVATAIAEAARSKILCALLDGKARTSTELSVIAEVSPATTSVHLQKLREAGLIELSVQGRHRYFNLANSEVAQALEAMLVIVGGAPFKPNTPARLRQARTCYDHLAGEVAVQLHDELLKRGWLEVEQQTYHVTAEGEAALAELGVSRYLTGKRRRYVCGCLDWSERRPHLGGALGAGLLQWMEQSRWIERDLDSRAVVFTAVGKRFLNRYFAINLQAHR